MQYSTTAFARIWHVPLSSEHKGHQREHAEKALGELRWIRETVNALPQDTRQEILETVLQPYDNDWRPVRIRYRQQARDARRMLSEAVAAQGLEQSQTFSPDQ